MSRIIALPSKNSPTLSPTQHLSLSCWHLAYAALWSEQTFSKDEIDRTIILIRGHLNSGTFTHFCERILLVRSHSKLETSLYLPQPSIWMHPGYTEGYAYTRLLHKKMQEKQLEIPGYQQEISVFGKFYYQYQREPNKACFYSCRKKLLRLKAYGLLQLFYQVIAYNQYC